MYSFQISFIVLVITGCALDSSTKNEKVQSDLVKVINTRSYKIHEDNTKEPVYYISYDSKVGLDFSWREDGYDDYDNLLYKENTTATGTYDLPGYRIEQRYYYNSKLGLVDSIKYLDKVDDLFRIRVYKRDSNGKLLSINYLNKNRGVIEQSVMKYEHGSRIADIIYNSQSQVTMKYTYTYLDGDEFPNYLTMTENDISENTSTKQDYIREDDNEVGVSITYVVDGKIVNVQKIEMRDYVRDICKTSIQDEYVGYTTYSSGEKIDQIVKREPSRTVFLKEVNDKGDVTRIVQYGSDINSKPYRRIEDVPEMNVYSDYSIDYTYNSRKDWINAVFVTSHRGGLKGVNIERFEVLRDIFYL